MIWMHYNLFIHSPFKEYLDYLQLWAILNNALKTNVYKYVWTYAFSSHGEELLVSVGINL